jgi:NADH:ubiquinone oxidoreductase subunit 5 (subunit L)/multisubunit Na+/H+ antiporter MnhA subunit
VAAGIFLFFKFNKIIVYCSFIKYIIYICMFTLLINSITACSQTDTKKLLAYSTICNCSLILISITLSNDFVSLLYFIIHGWFKSLSFLVIGVYIYTYNHNQDSRLLTSSNIYIIGISTILLFLLPSLSSVFLFNSSLFKHYLVSCHYYTDFIKVQLLLSILLSYSYSIRLLMLLYFSSNNNIKYNYIVLDYEYIYIIYIFATYIYIFILFSYYSILVVTFDYIYSYILLILNFIVIVVYIYFRINIYNIFYKILFLFFLFLF